MVGKYIELMSWLQDPDKHEFNISEDWMIKCREM